MEYVVPREACVGWRLVRQCQRHRPKGSPQLADPADMNACYIMFSAGARPNFAMNYDLNGRIQKQTNGTESLEYVYNNASYRPDHVNGTTPLAPGRDMSMDGNFQWDAAQSNENDRSIHFKMTATHL